MIGTSTLIAGAAVAPAGTCSPTTIAALVGAVFSDGAPACDLNGDGAVGAADVIGLIMSQAMPQATPSNTSTPAPTATPTLGQCAAAGAEVLFEIDNQSGSPDVDMTLTGTQFDPACKGTLATSYSVTLTCSGSGRTACGEVGGLAPGWWRHSIRVTRPDLGQRQHRASLLVSAASPNRAAFTVFAGVAIVRARANDGDGTLRNVLQTAGAAAKPLLIQFDPTVFPSGVPTTISLQFALPALATDDVTIDGTDALGLTDTRVIDAGGSALAVAALSITGARNHIIGVRLQNAGANNRDVVNISGAGADGNTIEDCVVQNAATGDGVGIDAGAGTDFGANANRVRDCDISSASDKGVKATTGAYAVVEHSWVHDNANGGVQSTLGAHVLARENLIERNRGSTAQNGLSVNARDDDVTPAVPSELITDGNISRANGANGLSVRASVAQVQHDYLATNGSSGVRIFNDVGAPSTAAVSGTSAVCNGADGAVVANTSVADFGGGPFASTGDNAFTQNNLPAGAANLRNATGMPITAVNDQWEHCGTATTCDDAKIADFDLSDHGLTTTFTPAQAHRAGRPPMITAVSPAKGRAGELLRIYGSGFNVIDGHFSETNCADVEGRNRCVPLRGNCVKINGVPAAVEAVTPSMLVVRWPFTCSESVPLIVTTDQGPTGATSLPFIVCTNQPLPGAATPTP